MNVRNMKRLIRALRGKGKNMFSIGTWFIIRKRSLRSAYKHGGGCGTTACIAGIAAAIDKNWKVDARHENLEYGGLSRTAAFALWAEISETDAFMICQPSFWPNRDSTTATEAADVLESYVKTGKLNLLKKTRILLI